MAARGRRGLVLERHRQDSGRFPGIDWGNFFVGNLLPVTNGNIIVAAVYWFAYLRKGSA